ncbi:MAG: hypothetical protein Q9165_003588 [Trypethelium subeluteriae]
MEYPHPGYHQDPNTSWAQDLPAGLNFDLENDSDFQAFLDDTSHSAGIPVRGRATRLQDYASSLTTDPETLTTHGSDGHLPGLMFDHNNLLPGNRVSSTMRDSTTHQGHEASYTLLALKMVQALHVSPSVCLSFTSVGPSKADDSGERSIDSVLMANREALQLVSSILQHTTSTSSQLQLLLTVICSKAAAWYRAIARNSLETTGNIRFDQPVTDSDGPSIASNEELVERVRHQPIEFGEYSFDSAFETKIRVMTVLHELQNVEKLFANLSGHMADSGFAASAWKAASAWAPISSRTDGDRAARPSIGPRLEKDNCPGETVQRRLNEFLGMQLEAIKAEVRAMMTPC